MYNQRFADQEKMRVRRHPWSKKSSIWALDLQGGITVA